MKVFDCTTFYNENMMLELRFNILDPYVDKFVITESKYSHSGEKKKLNFDINKFKDFKKKINYIVIENEPNNLFDETKLNLDKSFFINQDFSEIFSSVFINSSSYSKLILSFK